MHFKIIKKHCVFKSILLSKVGFCLLVLTKKKKKNLINRNQIFFINCCDEIKGYRMLFAYKKLYFPVLRPHEKHHRQI